jgi:hypothetical protein
LAIAFSLLVAGQGSCLSNQLAVGCGLWRSEELKARLIYLES